MIRTMTALVFASLLAAPALAGTISSGGFTSMTNLVATCEGSVTVDPGAFKLYLIHDSGSGDDTLTLTKVNPSAENSQDAEETLALSKVELSFNPAGGLSAQGEGLALDLPLQGGEREFKASFSAEMKRVLPATVNCRWAAKPRR